MMYYFLKEENHSSVEEEIPLYEKFLFAAAALALSSILCLFLCFCKTTKSNYFRRPANTHSHVSSPLLVLQQSNLRRLQDNSPVASIDSASKPPFSFGRITWSSAAVDSQDENKGMDDLHLQEYLRDRWKANNANDTPVPKAQKKRTRKSRVVENQRRTGNPLNTSQQNNSREVGSWEVIPIEQETEAPKSL